MISGVKWVPRGLALEIPLRSSLGDLLGPNCDVAKQDLTNQKCEPGKKKKKGKDGDEFNFKDENHDFKITPDSEVNGVIGDLVNDNNVISKYEFEKYDDEPVFGEFDLKIRKSSLNLKMNDQDDNEGGSFSSDVCSSELDEIKIESTDCLILIPRMGDEIPSLDVYIYEEDGNIYIHHNIFINETPTCIDLINNESISKMYMPREETFSRSYVAIGTATSLIDIWNLDTIDAACPVLVLGTEKKKHKNINKISRKVHTGAITCISSSRPHPNLLLSGSIDTTIKLWDITNPKSAVSSYGHHKGEIQSLSWHPRDSTIIISGGIDKYCCILDIRAPESTQKFKTKSSVECVKWDSFDDQKFFVGQESGLILLYDVKNGSKPILTLDAHDGAVTSIETCSSARSLVSTGSVDGTIKVWKIFNTTTSFLSSKSPKIGKILSMEFNPDDPTVLLAGGSKSKFITWDLSSLSVFHRSFPDVSVAPRNSIVPFNKISCYNFSDPENSDFSNEDSSEGSSIS